MSLQGALGSSYVISAVLWPLLNDLNSHWQEPALAGTELRPEHSIVGGYTIFPNVVPNLRGNRYDRC